MDSTKRKGGKRPGAGRPKGSKNARTASVAQRAAAEGVTPIEVMLGSMRAFWAMAEQAANDRDLPRAMAFCVKAADIAKDAAPYVHPRLAVIEHAGEVEFTNEAAIPRPKTYDEWLRYQEHLAARATANGGDTDGRVH